MLRRKHDMVHEPISSPFRCSSPVVRLGTIIETVKLVNHGLMVYGCLGIDIIYTISYNINIYSGFNVYMIYMYLAPTSIVGMY